MTWAEFIDAEHLLTLSHAKELVLWDVAKLKPIYVVNVATSMTPGLSAERDYVAVVAEGHVAILRTVDGTVVGVLPAETDGFNFHAFALPTTVNGWPCGKTAAYASGIWSARAMARLRRAEQSRLGHGGLDYRRVSIGGRPCGVGRGPASSGAVDPAHR